MDIAQIKLADAYPDGEEPHPEFAWVSPELAIPAPSTIAATVPCIDQTTFIVSIASPAAWTTLHAGGWPLPALMDNFFLCPGHHDQSSPEAIIPAVIDPPHCGAHTPQSCVIEYMDDPTPLELTSPSTTAAISSVWTNMDEISARSVLRRPARRLTLSTSALQRCLDSDEPSLGTPPVGSRFHVSAPPPTVPRS